MKKVVVLGAGMVGRVIAADLSKNFDVTAVDKNLAGLDWLKKSFTVKTLGADLSDQSAVSQAISDADLVISAVPGFMGFQTLKTIIQSGKNVVDISFFGEDAFELDDLARSKNVIAVVDCGVAPGMGNIILGHFSTQMKINKFECMVGGLPSVRRFPFEYKAPFSPVDVIEEYTRPARYVENGNIIVKPALSDPELVFFEEVGTLEAFNTDGLRSLIKTMNIADMKEKTLRYPGHIRLIESLREAGFFSKECQTINGIQVSPFDFTSKILYNCWKLEDIDPEFTIMRVEIWGEEEERSVKVEYNLFDQRDPVSGFSSMSRTTGFTCTAVANMVIDGLYKRKGISPPEYVGMADGCHEFAVRYLLERNVVWKESRGRQEKQI